MKKLIIGLVSVATLVAVSARAEEKQDAVKVTLSVNPIIEFDVVQSAIAVVPGPEDYAVKMQDSKGWNTLAPCSSWPEEDYGFADRSEAISFNMFTNARAGADVYVHALGNAAHNKTLRVEDVYLTVMTEKTYILNNKLEGSWAKAQTELDCPNAKWLQLNNEARTLCGVDKSTKATRLWVLKIGIGNLARYTENVAGYDADLTFTLMPRVI
ncbi:MAG: hypothetical protein QME42_06295 [bacterium]|nr:hypothetical protein [bacterium]